MLAVALHFAPEITAQWVKSVNLPGGPIHDFCSIDSDLFLAMDGRIFRSNQQGASWTPLAPPGPDLEVYSLEALDGTLLAGTTEGVYQSSPDGSGWAFFDKPGLSHTPALSLWTHLGYHYIGSVGAVYRSIDQGKTWAESKTGLPPDARITRFAGIVKIVVAGSDNRGVFITESMHWIPPPDYDSANNRIRDLEVFGNKVYAVTPHQVLESPNLGADWSPASLTLPHITCLLGDGALLYAGTENGIRYSSDKGITWEAFNDGIPENSAILSLEAMDGHLFASTETGVWRRGFPSSGIINHPSKSLLPPLPPIGMPGSQPLIEFTLPYAGPVNIKLVDVAGRTIGYGNHLQVKEGRCVLPMNAGALPPGRYILQISTP